MAGKARHEHARSVPVPVPDPSCPHLILQEGREEDREREGEVGDQLRRHDHRRIHERGDPR